ncbi:MAG: Lrp/AsnC family transcriptional regulator [Rubrivivax sp.]|nr:Lrp/AsnC family transcriptional regulator [Rubrivivax sp.]
MHVSITTPDLDETDLRLLDLLQADASLTNQTLAERAHTSPATALRRVRRLQDQGLIARQVALLDPHRLGAGLSALVEITLDRQGAEHLQAFAARAAAERAVQQCWQVSPGPDFVLVVHVADMPAYQALVQRLFTQDANVRNVKAFFSVACHKFDPRLDLSVVRRARADAARTLARADAKPASGWPAP